MFEEANVSARAVPFRCQLASVQKVIPPHVPCRAAPCLHRQPLLDWAVYEIKLLRKPTSFVITVFQSINNIIVNYSVEDIAWLPKDSQAPSLPTCQMEPCCVFLATSSHNSITATCHHSALLVSTIRVTVICYASRSFLPFRGHRRLKPQGLIDVLNGKLQGSGPLLLVWHTTAHGKATQNTAFVGVG